MIPFAGSAPVPLLTLFPKKTLPSLSNPASVVPEAGTSSAITSLLNPVKVTGMYAGSSSTAVIEIEKVDSLLNSPFVSLIVMFADPSETPFTLKLT